MSIPPSVTDNPDVNFPPSGTVPKKLPIAPSIEIANIEEICFVKQIIKKNVVENKRK